MYLDVSENRASIETLRLVSVNKGPLLGLFYFSLHTTLRRMVDKDSFYNILKAIKNASGSGVGFLINISLIYLVFVLTSVPNVRERFSKLELKLHTSAKKFGER